MNNHYYQTGDRVRAKYVEENAPDHNATGTIIGPPNDKNTYPVKLDHPINWGYANIDDHVRYKEYEIEHIQTHDNGPFDAPDAAEQDYEAARELRQSLISHPAHYVSHPSGIEPIEITKHETFLRGNILKYVLRAPYKGNELQDLLKAQQYLTWEVERVEREQTN